MSFLSEGVTALIHGRLAPHHEKSDSAPLVVTEQEFPDNYLDFYRQLRIIDLGGKINLETFYRQVEFYNNIDSGTVDNCLGMLKALQEWLVSRLPQ